MISEDLIFEVFPPKIARALLAGQQLEPERYECVSIFFSEIVGGTDLCSQLPPQLVMDMLHRLYSRFDAMVRELGLFKVETIGDAYMAVANLRTSQPDSHAQILTEFALRAMEVTNSIHVDNQVEEMGTVHIRVGLHCGPVVASVVGTLNRRYCLFGDTVNTASRMESNSEAGRVHCSKVFATLLAQQWPAAQLMSRGISNAKGKGPMEMFWVEQPVQGATETTPNGLRPPNEQPQQGKQCSSSHRMQVGSKQEDEERPLSARLPVLKLFKG